MPAMLPPGRPADDEHRQRHELYGRSDVREPALPLERFEVSLVGVEQRCEGRLMHGRGRAAGERRVPPRIRRVVPLDRPEGGAEDPGGCCEQSDYRPPNEAVLRNARQKEPADRDRGNDNASRPCIHLVDPCQLIPKLRGSVLVRRVDSWRGGSAIGLDGQCSSGLRLPPKLPPKLVRFGGQPCALVRLDRIRNRVRLGGGGGS